MNLFWLLFCVNIVVLYCYHRVNIFLKGAPLHSRVNVVHFKGAQLDRHETYIWNWHVNFVVWDGLLEYNQHVTHISLFLHHFWVVTIIARSLAVMVSGERQRASQVLYGEILYIEIRSWLSIKYTNIHKWPTHFLWPMNAQSCYASHQQGFITIPSVLKKTPTLFWIKDTFLLTLERRHFLPEPITRDRVFQNWPFHSERPVAYCRKSHSCYRHQVFQVSQGSCGFCLMQV